MAGSNDRLKITFDKNGMNALLSALLHAYKNYQVDDELDMLLFYCLQELRDNLAVKVIKKQTQTMTFQPKDAISLWALLSSFDLPQFKAAEQHAILSCLADCDQYVKSLKPQIAEMITDKTNQ